MPIMPIHHPSSSAYLSPSITSLPISLCLLWLHCYTYSVFNIHLLHPDCQTSEVNFWKFEDQLPLVLDSTHHSTSIHATSTCLSPDRLIISLKCSRICIRYICSQLCLSTCLPDLRAHCSIRSNQLCLRTCPLDLVVILPSTPILSNQCHFYPPAILLHFKQLQEKLRFPPIAQKSLIF